MLLTPAKIKPKSFESRRNSLFTRDNDYCACLGARLLPQSYQHPNLSEGADRVGGQLRGDKECPFSGVTKSGRVWRKVPESGARSVGNYSTSHPSSDTCPVRFYNLPSSCHGPEASNTRSAEFTHPPSPVLRPSFTL